MQPVKPTLQDGIKTPYFKKTNDLYSNFLENKTKIKKQTQPKNCFDQKYSVGIDVLPSQTQDLIAKKGAVFNLLLVGESGLGKTTFVNTLFGTSILPSVWHKVEDLKPTVHFSRTTEIVRHTAHLTEDNFSLDFTVVDTPGFGDFIDNTFGFLPITNYIDEQLRSYMFQEEQPNRTELKDNRVHACLFFINSTSKGLSPMEICALKHISSRVNLIPVIAKADCLTTNELKEIRKAVREIIEVQEIKVCEFIEDEEVKKKVLKQIPYSVIGSESYVINDSSGASVLGRKYKWGIAEVENEKHCDFVKLRDLLMAKNMADLISSTESYFETCRDKLIKIRIKQAKDGLEADDLIKELNFDDPDKNGIQNYKILSRYGKKAIDELVIEWSPIFIQQQLNQKKIFTDAVQQEEKKFKEWKKALFNKQSIFNGEIEDLHDVIRNLNAGIAQLKEPTVLNEAVGQEVDEKKKEEADENSIEVTNHSFASEKE